jgi:glucose/arabinose dehydrogenase
MRDVKEGTMRRTPRVSLAVGVGLLALTAGAALPLAQQDRPNPAASSPSTSSPPEQPLIVVTENKRRLRVVPLARGLSHPWGMALLPDGRTILVTERPGRLRIVRDGVLDRTPVGGVPTVNPTFIGGLNDVALHPAFSTNQLVYLSLEGRRARRHACSGARPLDGRALTDVRDICRRRVGSRRWPDRRRRARSAAASSSAPTACCT